MKAGRGARFQGSKDNAMTIIPDSEPEHEASATAHLLDEIALYGYRPFCDEADPRPLPEERIAAGADGCALRA